MSFDPIIGSSKLRLETMTLPGPHGTTTFQYMLFVFGLQKLPARTSFGLHSRPIDEAPDGVNVLLHAIDNISDVQGSRFTFHWPCKLHFWLHRPERIGYVSPTIEQHLGTFLEGRSYM